ncbi:MAG: NYN domain-containing protein [Candidatus Pacearchaeota archaeon]|jgi:uncharacterized LabA/DUF88 family protein
MGNNSDERIMIFIDGSNLYHILKNLLYTKRPNDFNFERFVNYLTKNRKLIKTYYYNSPLDRKKDEEGYIKQQKFFDKIQRIIDFNFVLCRMQKRKVDGKVIYEVKEDDIHLAVDMVKFAYKNEYDKAILISSDGDFVPAVQAVQEKGKKVENVGFENKFSYHLKQICDDFITLKKGEVEQFFD